MTIDFAAFTAPFPADLISWRVGSTTQAKDKGMALAYIDARDVMERLDAVCGPAGWQCRYPHANGKTVCEIGLLIDGQWIWKADGAGDTDHEAEKGALSDAFKRAAVRWGIGRYLYNLDSPWVAIEQRGKSYVIKDSEFAKLRALLIKDAKANTPEPPPPDPTLDELRKRVGTMAKAIDGCGSLAALDKVLTNYGLEPNGKPAPDTALYEVWQAKPEGFDFLMKKAADKRASFNQKQAAE